MVFLLHAGAGAVAAAGGVGNVGGHGGQQRVAGRNRSQAVVPDQLLHFTRPGVPVVGRVAGVGGHVVEGDIAVVEVQRGRRGHVRGAAVLVELGRTVPQDGLLLDGPRHQLGRAERRGRHDGETVSPSLDLQLLDEHEAEF